MEKVKTFIKTRSVGYWLMAGAFVCGLVALIAYLSAGTSESIPNLYGSVIAGLVIFVVFSAAMLVYELRMGKYLTAAVGLYTFLMFMVVQIPYITLFITTHFMGYLDPFEWDGGVIVTMIFSLIAFGLSIASAAMDKSGLAREKKAKKSKKNAEESEEVEA